MVNSYARTPPLVWKMGWMPSPAGELRTHLPPLPTEYLQEKHVLKDFVYRVNTIGVSLFENHIPYLFLPTMLVQCTVYHNA